MKKRLTTSLFLIVFQCLLFLPLQAQLSSSIVGPSNNSGMADEIAFLYQAQLNVPFSNLSTFIQNPPVPIGAVNNCPNPEPSITSQNDKQITFKWPGVAEKKEYYWVRYLNMRTGARGIERTSSNTLTLVLENGPYIFMFQKECHGFGSNEYIIIDDKPISLNGGNDDGLCDCETLLPIADVNDFEPQLLSGWPMENDFAETYYVRVKTYFGESDFTTPPDMYSSFSFTAYGSNGEVSLLVYRNACDSNADHDFCSIFATDDANTDLEEGEGGNDSPAFLQFTFADGIKVYPLGSFYSGKIHVRKCENTGGGPGENNTNNRYANIQAASAFPNPGTDEIQLNYFLPTEEEVHIQLFNSLGELVKVLSNDQQDAGAHQLAINLSSFPAGAYYCSIRGATKNEGLWLIKR